MFTIRSSFPLALTLSTLATNGDDILAVLPSELEGGAFDGGQGTDTLQLLGGGIFDLRVPTVFAGLEIVLGSDQDDTVIVDEARFAGITTFDGGADAQTHWDELVLHGHAFDFSARTLIGIDRLSLQTDNAVLTVADAATAMRAYGVASQNDTLIASGVTFTAAELRTLHKHGIDTVVDLAGPHTNLAPVTTALQGDRFEAKAGQKIFVDAGRDAALTEDDGRLALLSVSAPRGSAAPGRLGLDLNGNVTLIGGYAAGSTVKVGTTEVGLLWDAGDAGLSIVFNANATPDRVEDVLHALTYTMADAVPQASTQQQIVVTLADEGGRRSVSTVTIDQIVQTRAEELTLSRDSVLELSSKGRLVGLLTAHLAGAGDSFTYTLVDDAGGRFDIEDNRLVVENGVRLDYEQARSHRVVVRATGPDNHIIERSFIIGVEDVADEITSGSDGDDILIGGAGRDRLSGGLGNDRIYGKSNADTVSGGPGLDVFVFDTKPSKKNLDRIADFNVKDDTIWLDNAVFKALGKKGTPSKPAKLNAKMFWKGKAAHDENDRIIYNAKNGALYYDADGSGDGTALKIAVLSKHLKTMTHRDFLVV